MNNSTTDTLEAPPPSRSWMTLHQDRAWAKFLNFLMRMPGFLPACHIHKAYGQHLNWQHRLSALQHYWEDPAKNLLQTRICKELFWHILKDTVGAHSSRYFKFHHYIRLAHETINFVAFTILNFYPLKFLNILFIKVGFFNLSFHSKLIGNIH